MKKIILLIIAIFSLFSIENNALAKNISQNGFIGSLMNFDVGPVSYELSLEKLDTYSFRDAQLKSIYTDLVKYDRLTRSAILSAYAEWSYDYYTTNGIVKNYSNFVYHTNNFFYYLSLIDKNKTLENNHEIQDAVLSNYKSSQSYYKKVQSLISKAK